MAVSQTRPIVLAAGGTGGHMFPAEALARELIGRGRAVDLVTDQRGAAFGDRVPGVATHRIRSGRFGAGLVSKAMGAAGLACGFFDARRVLRQLGPAVVIGFGGYPSVPTVLAAAAARLPTVIHEQNAVLGRANRLLAPRVRRIAISFAATSAIPTEATTRVVHTGNPVRPAIGALREVPYRAPATDEPFNLLVFGGSQGARVFSDVVPAAVASLSASLRRRLRIVQQARPEDLDTVRTRYAATEAEVELASFFDDMPDRLKAAHLVIARAGASTMTELMVAGRPSILVPYPFAMDDHQSANARALATSGGAIVIAQPQFDALALAGRIEDLAGHPDRLSTIAEAALDAARPDATSLLADLVLAVANTGNGTPHPLDRQEAA